MNRHDSWVNALDVEGRLGKLDLHFCRLMLAKANQPSAELALAAALVCRATAEGHVLFDLRGLADRSLQAREEQGQLELPPLDEWRDRLRSSGVVGEPGDYQPLILDRTDRLYLYRYWDYEQRVARRLQLRAQQQVLGIDLECLSVGLNTLFEDAEPSGTNWQRLAAATALLRTLSVISGGPGTGKTTTVTKILLLLRQQPGGERLRIALAAPTGKAASRMQESVRQAKSRLPLSSQLAATIPEQAATLHRLLGFRRGLTGFIHQADNPLPVDVLILDEASMVDVALMAKLLDALPAKSRLILLGDKDQLASVEAGSVLGDICNDCHGPAPQFAHQLCELTGEVELETGAEGGGICDSVVVLKRSYRFGNESAIGRLAQAVNGGEADRAVQILTEPPSVGNLAWLASGRDVAAYAAERYRDYFRLVGSGTAVETLFERMRSFRLLCALRQGPNGAQQMNRRITELLRQATMNPEQEWFAGRPIMVTRNDYQQKLYNGDLGITLPHPDRPDELAVVFQRENQELYWLAPARLPPHETVFAMTVHKSQGSEFDQVLLLMPERDTPVLSREMLYTAITRARSSFTLAASKELFQLAVRRRLRRSSGLADLLQHTDLF